MKKILLLFGLIICSLMGFSQPGHITGTLSIYGILNGYLAAKDTTSSIGLIMRAQDTTDNKVGSYVPPTTLYNNPGTPGLTKALRVLSGDPNLLFPIWFDQAPTASGVALNSGYITFVLFYTEKTITCDSVAIGITVSSSKWHINKRNKLGLYSYNPTSNISTLIDSTKMPAGIAEPSDSLLWQPTYGALHGVKRAWTLIGGAAPILTKGYYYVAFEYTCTAPSGSGTNPSVFGAEFSCDWIPRLLAHIADDHLQTGGRFRTTGYAVLTHLPATIDMSTLTIGASPCTAVLYHDLGTH